jgi:hypothetical protein
MTQLTDNVFSVEVPESAHGFKIMQTDYRDVLCGYIDGWNTELVDFIKGSLPEIIGLSSELTEEQCSGLVEPLAHTVGYLDYTADPSVQVSDTTE